MNTTKKGAIGIIGGMGPEASEKFYGLLIRLAQTEYGIERNDEFPEIYLASVPVPDFISETEHLVSARDMLIDRIKRMDALPIRFYCMACNTGHLLLNDLTAVTASPFVSLLHELPEAVRAAGVRSVGLLASPVTLASGMYQTAFERNGIRTVKQDPQDREEVGNIIKATISGKNIEANSLKIQDIAGRLFDAGAEGIVEGCTEIPLIFPKQYKIPVFDTLEILARAVLKRYYC